MGIPLAAKTAFDDLEDRIVSRSSTTWTKSEAAQASVKARMAESPLRGPGHPRIGRQAAAGIAPTGVQRPETPAETASFGHFPRGN